MYVTARVCDNLHNISLGTAHTSAHVTYTPRLLTLQKDWKEPRSAPPARVYTRLMISHNSMLPLHLVEAFLRSNLDPAVSNEILVKFQHYAEEYLQAPEKLPKGAKGAPKEGEASMEAEDFSYRLTQGEGDVDLPAPAGNTPDLPEHHEEEPAATAETHIADTPAPRKRRTASERGEPKPKQEYVILLAADRKDLPEDLTGWVLQMDEGISHKKLPKLLENVYFQYNASKKGQQDPANTLGAALEMAQPKVFKAEGLALKTRSSVWCVAVPNKAPEDQS